MEPENSWKRLGRATILEMIMYIKQEVLLDILKLLDLCRSVGFGLNADE